MLCGASSSARDWRPWPKRARDPIFHLMRKFWKSTPPAARVEFAAAAMWIALALAGAIAVTIQWTVTPPAPSVSPDGVVHSNPPLIQPILTLLVVGVVAALPNAGVGALLRSRDRSGLWTAALLAIVAALIYIGLVAWVTIDSLAWAAGHPEANAVDMDFLVAGILVVVAGLMHATAGVMTISRLLRGSPDSGARPAAA